MLVICENALFALGMLANTGETAGWGARLTVLLLLLLSLASPSIAYNKQHAKVGKTSTEVSQAVAARVYFQGQHQGQQKSAQPISSVSHFCS